MEIEPHKPYAEYFGRKPDFVVEYCWNPDEEVKSQRRIQGLRSDFLYEGDDPGIDGIHMIWPEYLDDSGHVILDRNSEVPRTGFATMWILMEERIEYHAKRMKPGTKGHMVVGSKKLADVTVIHNKFQMTKNITLTNACSRTNLLRCACKFAADAGRYKS